MPILGSRKKTTSASHKRDTAKKSKPNCLFSSFILSLTILNLFAVCIDTSMLMLYKKSFMRKTDVQICL